MKTRYKILISSSIAVLSVFLILTYIDNVILLPLGYPSIPQNDFQCGSEWIVDYEKNFQPDEAEIKKSIRKTIAEFGNHVNIPWREITIMHDENYLTVTVEGIWEPKQIQHNTITETIIQVDNVKNVKQGRVWCQ